jgi:SPP1 family predicted phage head-tail adaptor
MQPGKLDQRITLQAKSTASDGGGGRIETWANFASVPSVWAHVRPMSARETMADERMTATAETMFTIRYRSDVNETHRLLWQSEEYNIRSVRRRGGRELYLEIVAERGVAT